MNIYLLRKLILFLLILIVSKSYAQYVISPSSIYNTDLAIGVNYPGCNLTTSATKLGMRFNVSGIPNATLSSTFAVAEVRINFDATCGSDFFNTLLILQWSDGVTSKCYYFFDGYNVIDASWDATGTGILQQVPFSVPVYLRDQVSSADCGPVLAYPNFDQENFLHNRTTTSNAGYYRAGCSSGCSPTQPSSVTLASAFSGLNPNATWTIYAFYRGSDATKAPCVRGGSLVFGNPTPIDERTSGDNCSTAIVFDGTPICASTSGKGPSDQMPGSVGSSDPNSFLTIGGQVCTWNQANNNDVWIKLNPGPGYYCISISGLTQELQSIVVEATNLDGDGQDCTTNAAKNLGNDPNWIVKSCPRLLPNNCDNTDNCSSGIYTTTAGTRQNQQHCFTTEPNKSYYLIVDGNGGQQSPFYISGIRGTSAASLSNHILKLNGTVLPSGNSLQWTSTILNESVSFYELERSFNNKDYHILFSQPVNMYSQKEFDYLDKLPLAGNNFYRVKVILKDGSVLFSTVELLKGNTTNKVTVFPNPVFNSLSISSAVKIQDITVFNSQGQLMYSDKPAGLQSLQIPTQAWAKGQYLVIVTDLAGNVERIKVLK